MKTNLSFRFPAFFGAAVLVLSACSNPNNTNTQRGAVGGAAAGALIGGIIGHQSGEAGAGAALGAAAGAAAGGAYGHSKDKQVDSTTRDSYGYTRNDYYNLLNAQERDVLKARAGGRTDVDTIAYLTDDERANLRRRAAGQNEIGR